MRYSVLTALPALFFAATVHAADLTETKLNASDAAKGDNFGASIAISGSTVVVGVPYKDTFAGAAYVFDATTGAQTTSLRITDPAEKSILKRVESIFSRSASGATTFDQFGGSVAVSGSVAIVGATGSPQSYNYPGAAYLFDTSTGAQTGTLTASDGVAEDFFGRSVGLTATTAIVGAMGKDTKQGAAYLFDLASGKLTATLTSSDAAEGAGFGISVAISGTTAIVGAVEADGKKGAAYLFDTTTGKQTAKLTASDAIKYAQFGGSVAIIGTTAIAGAI